MSLFLSLSACVCVCARAGGGDSQLSRNVLSAVFRNGRNQWDNSQCSRILGSHIWKYLLSLSWDLGFSTFQKIYLVVFWGFCFVFPGSALCQPASFPFHFSLMNLPVCFQYWPSLVVHNRSFTNIVKLAILAPGALVLYISTALPTNTMLPVHMMYTSSDTLPKI